jgi:Lar family restriction alleviation protein
MSDLKPCPFCGGSPVLDGKSDDVRVRCEDGCGAAGSVFYFGSEDYKAIESAETAAQESWNRRFPLESAPPAQAHPMPPLPAPAREEATYTNNAIFAAPPPKCLLSWGGFNLYGDWNSINEARRLLHDAGTVPELKQRIAYDAQEIERLRADAERYRWLRDAPQDQVEVFFATDRNKSGWGDWNSWSDKDAAIDALAGTKGKS